MNSNTSSDEELRKELNALGAREFERVALGMEPKRGLAALQYALAKKVDHPIPYAIKLFDSPEWHPLNEKPRRSTNRHVGAPSPLPEQDLERNLEEARKILAMLKGEK